MMTFRNRRLREHTLPMSTAWLLNDIAEAKGKQELFTRQPPQVLKARREKKVEWLGRGQNAQWRKLSN